MAVDIPNQITETGGTPLWGYNVRDFGADGNYFPNSGGNPGNPSSSDPNDGGTANTSPDAPTQSAVQDLTDVSDDTAAIQACLDAAGSAGGVHVMIPAGGYLISDTLYVPPNVHVWGEGKYSTFIYQTATDKNGINFTYPRPDGGGVALRGGLHSLSVYGPGSGTGKGVFVALVEDDGSTIATSAPIFGGTFDDVMTRFFGFHGFHFGGIFGTRVVHCDAWENGYGTTTGHGFVFDGGTTGFSGTGTYQTSTVIEGCYANADKGYGYIANKQQYSSYISNSCDSCSLGGYMARDVTAITYTSCGAESTEDSTLDLLPVPGYLAPNTSTTIGMNYVNADGHVGTPGNNPTTNVPYMGQADGRNVQPMPYGFQVVSSVGAGSAGVTFLDCWTYGITTAGWRFRPDDITTAANFTVQGTMMGCTNLTINKVGADFIAAVMVHPNADVVFINNKLQPSPTSDRTKIAQVNAAANSLFIGSNNLYNEPGGLSKTLTSPTLYPYTDSVQAINRYTQNVTSPFAITSGNPALVPFAAIGMPGQTAPVIEALVAAQTGDAQTVFLAGPAYTIIRPTTGNPAILDVQNAASATVFKVGENDAVTISQAGKGLRLPLYASVSAALSAIPSGVRHGMLIMVDNSSANGSAAGTGDRGLHVCLGIGSSFYALPNGFPAIS